MKKTSQTFQNQLTVATYSRAELISTLPELGDALTREAKQIDDKVKLLIALANEIFTADGELMLEISENWTSKEINDSIGKKFLELHKK